MTGDYATPLRLAIYLEIGWSDYLFASPEGARKDDALPYPNPLVDRVPPDFTRHVARLVKLWATRIGLDPTRYCDIGGAIGRAVFEVEGALPALRRLVLVEPSTLFCEWAEHLLASDAELPPVPVVDRSGAQRLVTALTRPPPIANAHERLTIINGPLEDYRPPARFDLVTCLNVLDRHPSPRVFAEELPRLMSDRGLLVVSCPFDFREESTPNKEHWIDDLNELFTSDRWEHVGDDEVFYEYRASKRQWTRLCAQVVGKRWMGG